MQPFVVLNSCFRFKVEFVLYLSICMKKLQTTAECIWNRWVYYGIKNVFATLKCVP